MKKTNILFVCTGNACRSQMAEGWAKTLGGERVAVTSAGIEAHGLNPQAVTAMHAVGVDISQQFSQILNADMLAKADVVVTVCDHAQESLPPLPANISHYHHWPLPDPAKATGSAMEQEKQFHAVRDHLHRNIELLLHVLDPTAHETIVANRACHDE